MRSATSVFAHGLVLDHGDHRVGLEGGKQRRIAHRGGRVDPVTHPLAARRPQCARVSILQIVGQPETVGVRVPGARLLIVACEHDRRAIQLTRAMARERRRRSVDAALRQDDRAAVRSRAARRPPASMPSDLAAIAPANMSWRRRCTRSYMLTPVMPCTRGSVPVEIVECPTAVFVGRKLTCAWVNHAPRRRRAVERRHRLGVPIEVVAAHAIQNEQHDNARSGKALAKTGNTRPVAVGGIDTPSAAASVGATSCCTAGIEYTPVFTAGPTNINGIETS